MPGVFTPQAQTHNRGWQHNITTAKECRLHAHLLHYQHRLKLQLGLVSTDNFRFDSDQQIQKMGRNYQQFTRKKN